MFTVMATCTWVLVLIHRLFLPAHGGVLRVMLVHNSAQHNAGFKDGIMFFQRYINSIGGFTIEGDPRSPYQLHVILCEQDFRSGGSSRIQACVTAATKGVDLNSNAVGVIDAIIFGSSSYNAEMQAAAENAKIPNLHCSGGNPTVWTSRTPHAFGLHMPFPWYSRGAIHLAKLRGLTTALVIRDYDWGFPRASAVAAMERTREVGIRVIGPSAEWCQK